jgi:GH24 family phage-related lysozyme (muramidase)
MTRLDPSIRAGWIAFNRNKEGIIPWPYLCRRKVWTVAIGVTPSLALAYTYRWILTATRQPATRADVDEAWHALMSAPAAVRDRIAQIGAGEARKHVKIELPPDELERATLVRFDEFESALLKTYPAMVTWPVEAQTVCMSIAWAAGTGAAFPKMYAAMHRGDWLTAADECALRVVMADGFRNGGLVPRNHHNRALLLALAKRSLYVEHGQLADALFTGGLDDAGRERLGMVRALLDVFQVAEMAGQEIPRPFPWPTVAPPAEDRPSSPPVVIVEDEAIPDTDPMTDVQRAETLALVHATMATSLAEDRAEGYRRR